ncbi:CRISPR-associated protein Cst1 [Alkalithermobacter thermoalcaliphilus JW-YL-7 = DSM 7308]|uniref:CRISPR-associated protein CXXC-CXXC region n=1 Tax=Alkalithermobacter thermoalcaliphilus JW-YL-7 = DSM 7308 TaxID=1121328 RepID=A0A150FQS9_CLOPD|nr:CRISPR-associated protein CXXC-CXXC region [[Clostridium] paradoxum JW-YL-7 = DSM 7308]SHL29824.1 CRISPR-associated protein Cst1 [[Clostridium] paradoxum JW-YL-7 = DSM 7308]
MKIKVYSGDWFYNMGIIGFLNIAYKAGKKEEIILKDNYIEFESSFLENFHHYYFAYFMEEYNVYNRVKSNIQMTLNYTKSNIDKIKDNIPKIRKVLKDQADKVKKIDKELYEEIDEKLKQISQIKKKEQIEELELLVNECLEMLSKQHINEKLTLNLYKFIIGDNYFGQVSYFNVAKSKLGFEELKETMYKDYLSGIIEYGNFTDLLFGDDFEKFKIYIEEKVKSKNVSKNLLSLLKDINKNFIKKNKTIDEIKGYLDEDSIKSCEMCGEYKGIVSDYTESNFAPLAVSSNNARNMFWEFNTDYPICDICKLILFCTPAGSIYMKKNYITDAENEFYGFINMDTSVEELYSSNIMLRKKQNKDNPFNELIVDMISENVQRSEWKLKNILFVEFKASVNAKKCSMNYFNMPGYLAKFFVKEHKSLSSISNNKFKAAIVDIVIKNKDLKYLINNTLRQKVKDSMQENKKSYISAYDCYKAVSIRYLINCYKGGKKDMDDKKLKAIYYSGRAIHDYFVDNNAENKINSIAYKLLNTSKVRNKKDFMDIILRTFMAAQMSVPQLFLDIMSENQLDFESIAYTFVSGLISEKYEGTKKEEVN